MPNASLPDHPDISAELSIAGAAPAYHDWLLDGFGTALSGNVVEVGAGVGIVSERLLARDAVRSLLAIEPFPSMHPALNARLKQDPRARSVLGTLKDLAPEALGTIDALVYVNVLEHIQDDRAELREMHARLRIGGAALIFVPALPALMSDFDRALGHFRRYRRAELEEKLISAGFVVERIRWFDALGIPLWWLLMRVLGGRPNPRSVRLYDRFAVPLLRRLEAWIAPPIGKNLLVVARKP